MYQFTGKVHKLEQIAGNCFLLQFFWTGKERPLPGQFLTLRISGSSVPLLRRPFAVSGFDPAEKLGEFIFLKRGAGTSLLAGKDPGETLDVIGPLGVGFPLPEPDQYPVLIAGGIGIGPILFLAQMLNQLKIGYDFFTGSRDISSLPEQTVRERVPKAKLFTDNGSAGLKGTPVDALPELLGKVKRPVLYACGPDAMLRVCHFTAAEAGVPCWVSVEQVMACGVGACMGCAVPLADGVSYARACTEGPVFRSSDLWWEPK
ncbi:MAG: dihydroorotate dehydrogenase electron transfer subunit [Spirochaetia bacterium]